MRYHARALAASGVDVDLVGLEGTPLPREITDEPRITVHRLATPRLRQAGIRILGLEGNLGEARRRDPGRCWDFRNDPHWNVDAHRLAADVVHTYLEERHILDRIPR